MSGQFRFSPLNLKGNERPKISTVEHLCNLPGCFKYIEPGEWMVRWGSFDLHADCAARWCDDRGIGHRYAEKEKA